MSRYESEYKVLIEYLEGQNFPVESFQKTLRDIKDQQEIIRFAVDLEISGKTTTSKQIASAAHDRLAEMGGAERSAEQVHLADTRRAINALDKVTTRYQAELDALQAAYGDVAARHAAYRATETDVFTAIKQVATEASTSDLSALASLKVALAAKSDSENRAPQLLILDAKRVQWELAAVQSSYETGVAPYTAYLTEHAWPLLDHTSAPKAGMSNVVGYAESRMQRVNEAIKAIYDGIRRRETALSLAAADAATRDQLRAADATQREASFLSDMTTRVNDMWKAPPTGSLSLQLQGERMTTMTAFLQLEAVCKDVGVAATWRAPGCQKVSSEASKVRTYLNQTLPFTIKFGVQKMRNAGFDAAVLSDIEAKAGAGQLKQAVQLYDAIVRSGGKI